jgi:O-antigen/teichoic acid export membrane protein
MTSAPGKHALSRARLATNVLWNFLGTGLPMLAAVVAIPQLIAAIGTARFGVLSLAWIVVGYFSLFDFGLGRAVTQLIAQKLGRKEEAGIPELVWAAMVLMIGLGLAGALLAAALSPWLTAGRLQIPQQLQAETLTAFYILAASIPIVILTTALRGILEAYQRFGLVNVVRVPLGLATYLGPLAVLPYSIELPALVATLVAARVVSFIVYFLLCVRLYPELRRPQPLSAPVVRQLLTFGGWMTVSNVAAPLLLYLGRLLIAVLVSAQAVAYFSTPYDVVINLLIIPGVLVGVLFPAFSQMFQSDRAAVRPLYLKSLLLTAGIMAPLTIATWLLAKPGLGWWINEEFASHGYRVAQLLALGIFINSFGHLSQALVQAYGRPDLTAKLHVVELIAYVPYLWWLIEHMGIDGAAIAWVVRVTLSTVALWLIARRCLAGAISVRN